MATNKELAKLDSDEANKAAAEPVDLRGPGFPPMPTEPAKPHTEEELNKVGQTLGDSAFGLTQPADDEAKKENDSK